MDVKRFKGEYHQLLLKKGLLTRRGQAMEANTTQMKKTELVQQSTNNSNRPINPHLQRETEYIQDDIRCHVVVRSCRERSSYYDPLNDGSVVLDDVNEDNEGADQRTSVDILLRGNISSTLFDLVREAVFAWNGVTSSGGQNRLRRPSITTLQLVDTLYLF
jgi:hypothetical protein